MHKDKNNFTALLMVDIHEHTGMYINL